MWAAVDERFIEESHFQLRERAVLSVLDFYLKHFDEVAVKFFFYLLGMSILGVIRFLSVHHNSRGCEGKT